MAEPKWSNLATAPPLTANMLEAEMDNPQSLWRPLIEAYDALYGDGAFRELIRRKYAKLYELKEK